MGATIEFAAGASFAARLRYPAAPARPNTPWFGIFPTTNNGWTSPLGVTGSSTSPRKMASAHAAIPGARVSKWGICHGLPKSA
jgi:hypothetical protein